MKVSISQTLDNSTCVYWDIIIPKFKEETISEDFYVDVNVKALYDSISYGPKRHLQGHEMTLYWVAT